MIDISRIDYSSFDHSGVTAFLFHPRPEYQATLSGVHAESVMIPVDPEADVEARFYLTERNAPDVLFFHGNGEIVADYDEMATLYNRMGINFIPVDYRGYGRSTGRPTVTSMMRDAHVLYDFVQNRRKNLNHGGPLVIMGRSLGSAPALELACHYQREIDGLIIESGFAFIGPLLQLMGISMAMYGLSEDKGPRNIEKIRLFDKPTLIIHAQYDQIISLREGQALFDACPSPHKKLLMVPGANHNDIFFQGFRSYMQAIRDLMETISRTKKASPAA
jgi:alpha-beta hydrolase superfamily lysophospholipase